MIVFSVPCFGHFVVIMVKFVSFGTDLKVNLRVDVVDIFKNFLNFCDCCFLCSFFVLCCGYFAILKI